MEYLSTEKPLNINQLTLIPVVRINNNYDHDGNTTTQWFVTHKVPIAVIVCDANKLRVLSMDSAEISLKALIKELPETDAVVKSYCQQK